MTTLENLYYGNIDPANKYIKRGKQTTLSPKTGRVIDKNQHKCTDPKVKKQRRVLISRNFARQGVRAQGRRRCSYLLRANKVARQRRIAQFIQSAR